MYVEQIERRLHRLDARFDAAVATLHDSFERLLTCPPFTYATRPKRLPQKAVYLFEEAGVALYVGRTNRLRSRLGDHCRSSSGQNQSAFAYRLALASSDLSDDERKLKRAELVRLDRFAAAFSQEKVRVNSMNIRFVEENDDLTQALLEIYAATALGTLHNEFGTH